MINAFNADPAHVTLGSESRAALRGFAVSRCSFSRPTYTKQLQNDLGLTNQSINQSTFVKRHKSRANRRRVKRNSFYGDLMVII